MLHQVLKLPLTDQIERVLLMGSAHPGEAGPGTGFKELCFAIDRETIQVVNQLIATLLVKYLRPVPVAHHVSRDFDAFLCHQDVVADLVSEVPRDRGALRIVEEGVEQELAARLESGPPPYQGRDQRRGFEIVDGLPNDDAIVGIAIVDVLHGYADEVLSGKGWELATGDPQHLGGDIDQGEVGETSAQQMHADLAGPSSQIQDSTVRGERVSNDVEEALALQEPAIGKVVEIGTPTIDIVLFEDGHQLREIVEEQDDPMMRLVDQPLA